MLLRSDAAHVAAVTASCALQLASAFMKLSPEAAQLLYQRQELKPTCAVSVEDGDRSRVG